VVALGRARELGHHEAVFVQADGFVAEGASSNVFIVSEGVVKTPRIDTGILPGITRGYIIELCRRLEIPLVEGDLKPSDLVEADEMFLTSTLREVLPVVKVDEQIISSGIPGPTTLRIRTGYLSGITRTEAEEDHRRP
jgi:branched-subunit amino acid aminotransferase/4-amino-4-deoxychorismate lyase